MIYNWLFLQELALTIHYFQTSGVLVNVYQFSVMEGEAPILQYVLIYGINILAPRSKSKATYMKPLQVELGSEVHNSLTGWWQQAPV